jgi:hypothetical protein
MRAIRRNDVPPDVWGAWSIVTRYHWTQTFPAGKAVKVSHSYTNRPPGGLFYWTDPPEDYQTYLVGQYCIDTGTSKAMARALQNPQGDEFGNYGTAWNIAYVLRTANSWAGPIGKFTLTLDKGDPKNVISLCAEGVKKTGPTTFVDREDRLRTRPRSGGADRSADDARLGCLRHHPPFADRQVDDRREGPDPDADPPDQRVVAVQVIHPAAQPDAQEAADLVDRKTKP